MKCFLQPTLITLVFIIIFAGLFNSATASITLSTQLITPNTAGSPNVKYQFTFNMSTPAETLQLDSSPSFVITFSNTNNVFNISSVSSCTMSINSVSISPICSADSSSNSIVFVNITNTTIALSNLTVAFNTSGALFSGNPSISFLFRDSSSNLISNSSVNTTITVLEASLNLAVSSASNLTGATTTFTYTVTPSVPIQNNNTLQIVLPMWFNTTSTYLNNFATSPSCSLTCTLTNFTNTQTLTIRNLTYGTSVVLTVSSQKNPPSTAPITISASILSGSFVVMSGSTSFACSQPNSLKTVSFANANRSISASNSIMLTYVANNPIPAGSASYLRITSPLSLSYTFSSSNSSSSTSPTQTSSTDSSLLLTNLSASSITPNIAMRVGLFTLVNPPSSKKVTLTFTTQTVTNSTFYSIDTISLDISADVSTITTFNTPTLVNSAAYAVTSYTLSFLIVNGLISGSFIQIVFPVQTAIQSSSTCSSSLGTCIPISSSNTVNLTLNTSILSNSNVTLTVNSVRNPLLTQSSSAFTISTFYNSTDSQVDQLTSGMTVTSTSNPIKSTTVTPSSVVVNDIATYTFKINFTNPVPSNSVLNILFPSEIDLTASSPTFSGSNSQPCILNKSGQVLTFSSCFPSLFSSQLTLIVNSIQNPSSTKPTSSFNITSSYNSSLLEYLSSSLLVTMNTPTTFSSVAMLTSVPTVGLSSNYTFTITHTILPLTQAKVAFTIPSQIVIASPQCNAISGVSSVGCSLSAGVVTVTYNSAPTSKSIKFQITGFTNGWYAAQSTISVKSYTSDSTLYAVESGTVSVLFTQNSLTVSIASDQSIILVSNSSLKITISLPSLLPLAPANSLYLTISLPSADFTATSNCSTPNCQYVSSINGYNITGLSAGSFPLTVTTQATAGYFTTSSSLKTALYYNSYGIASDSTATVAAYCTNPCKQCLSSKSKCLSCLPSAYNLVGNTSYFAANNSCLATCPSAYFLNSSTNTCDICSSSCQNCSVSSTSCTSCNTGTYLSSSKCVTTCPDGTYRNTSLLQCVSCYPTCTICTTDSMCQACVSGYSLVGTVCSSSCPNTSVPVNGICTSCVGCATCSIVKTNCTSCDSSYKLYNTLCYSSCPPQTYASVANCYNCNSICYECVNTSTTCTSCSSGKYLYSSTCVSTCPAGTFQNSTVCSPCASQCATCTSLSSNCTSCASSYYKYNNNSCVTTCPDPTHPYNGVCINCLSPCVTCQGTASNCTSCESNLYLLNNTCMNSCPSAYYADTSNNMCLSCGDCRTCISPTNCTSCNQNNYLLNGLCYDACPASNPIVSGQTCESCSTSCLTCSLTPTNCTSCPGLTYLFRTTCVSSCPIGMYTNRIKQQCDDSLSSHIMFFPVLITCIVLSCLVFVSRLIAKNTSTVTALVSVLAAPEVAICAYFVYNAFTDVEGVDLTIPKFLGLACTLIYIPFSILFYIVNIRKLKEDPYLQNWMSSGYNYAAYIIVAHIALLNYKLFRLLYTRLFNLGPLSMYFKQNRSIFPHTTIITLLQVLCGGIPMMCCAVLMIYSKVMKDQAFYVAVETLVVLVVLSILALVDIYKPDDFFYETEYLSVKKYIDQTKDSKKKSIEEESVEAPGLEVESENCKGNGFRTRYNKALSDYLFIEGSSQSKLDDSEAEVAAPSSGIRIEQQETQVQGIAVLNLDSASKGTFQTPEEETNFNKGPKTTTGKKPKKRIHIFDPIQEEEADSEGSPFEQYLGGGDQSSNKRSNLLFGRQKSNQGKAQVDSDDQAVKNAKRRQHSQGGQEKSPPPGLRFNPFNLSPDDILEARSVLEPKMLKSRFQNIVQKRHQEALRMYRPEGTAQQQQQEEATENKDSTIKIKKRRKVYMSKTVRQAQEIYLQRLIVPEEKPTGATKKRKKRTRTNKDSSEYFLP